jgi:plasmid stabilization system protein ParE
VAQIIYSDDALEDFERIIDFLLESSPEAAREVLEKIRSAVDVLGAHPLIGRRIDTRLRELVISHGDTGYLALYAFDRVPDLVRILRIRHQREAGYSD